MTDNNNSTMTAAPGHLSPANATSVPEPYSIESGKIAVGPTFGTTVVSVQAGMSTIGDSAQILNISKIERTSENVADGPQSFKINSTQ